MKYTILMMILRNSQKIEAFNDYVAWKMATIVTG